jgi:rare lipoprotein A
MSYKVRLGTEKWRCGLAIFCAATILLSTSPTIAGGFDQVGKASWYGKKYHGRTTANGERFDMNALTAAHKRLPFGTKVRVTNLSNKRSLVVRINDRGPFAGGRIIDLSRRAAGILGFQQRGIARVRVQIVKVATKSARRYKHPRQRTRRKVSSEKSIRESLARSRAYQPVTLRPPRDTYR